MALSFLKPMEQVVWRSLLFGFLALRALGAQGQQGEVAVFTSGAEGHKTYRIPAILALPGGELLAFAEGRVLGGADYGDINIVMKRSTDKGRTWGALQTVADYASKQAGNPAPVLDLSDPAFPRGRLFLFYNTGNAPEAEVRQGRGLREVWYKTSLDQGRTWSEPVNITAQVHRPNQPQVNPAYAFAEDWRHYANTPGHAMQFASGPYKGRLFIAANHSRGLPQPGGEDYFAHGFYSDDHGKSFQLAATVPETGSNECMATELSGGRLMMNIRNQAGDVRARIVALSSTGGASWDSVFFDHQLPDPVNQGSLLTLGRRKGQAIVAFCNAADSRRRDNLMLRISFDEGRTWPQQHLIAKSPDGKGSYAAYSDLVQTGRREIGVLYEKNDYKLIVFTRVKWQR